VLLFSIAAKAALSLLRRRQFPGDEFPSNARAFSGFDFGRGTFAAAYAFWPPPSRSSNLAFDVIIIIRCQLELI
jgi:hypothetical protein